MRCGADGVARARSVALSADRVTFADGASFKRDLVVATNVQHPYALDVLCFLAQFAARTGGVINAAAYLKARARRVRARAHVRR